ncbi:MAG: hypothetical protein VB032_06645 [Burkholderiaceae bacterium]|nr:hypothetical protein [Burkholderiaceae bacterium]
MHQCTVQINSIKVLITRNKAAGNPPSAARKMKEASAAAGFRVLVLVFILPPTPVTQANCTGQLLQVHDRKPIPAEKHPPRACGKPNFDYIWVTRPSESKKPNR